MMFLFDTSTSFLLYALYEKLKVEKGKLEDLDKETQNQETHSSTTAPGSRRLLIMLYITAVSLYWMAQYLYIPTLPVYVRSKTDTLSLVGGVLSMYGLWQAIIRLPLGIVADWLGRRKPFIVICFALIGLGTWMMGITDNVIWLIIGRAIIGVAAGSWVLLIVAFNRLFPPREMVRATAMLTFVASFSKMLSTGMTGFLNNLGGYPLAFFLAAGTAMLAILVVLPIKEQRRDPQRDVLLPSALNAILEYVIFGVTLGFLPILANQLGATDVIQGILVTMNIAVFTAGTLVTTVIVRRTGVRRLVYLSFILLSTGIGLAALASSLFLIFVAQIFIGLGAGISYPVLMGMSIEHVAEAERATAMGLHQAVYAVGMFTGPWLSGILADIMGIQPMFGVTGLTCLGLGLLGTRWLSEKCGCHDSPV
jgi:DHA1 family multidrug resistance protein-like MFS transporter